MFTTIYVFVILYLCIQFKTYEAKTKFKKMEYFNST